MQPLKKEEKKEKKSCNLSKIVSVLLSASVERVGVSRMRDLKKKDIGMLKSSIGAGGTLAVVWNTIGYCAGARQRL